MSLGFLLGFGVGLRAYGSFFVSQFGSGFRVSGFRVLVFVKVLQGPYKGFADEVLLEFNHGRFLPPWKARLGFGV